MSSRRNKDDVRFWEHARFALLFPALLLAGLALVAAEGAGKLLRQMRAAVYMAGAIVVLALAAAGWGVWQYYRTIDLGDEKVTIIVEKGDSFARVARALKEKGVVSSELAIKIPARWQGVDRRLIPGRYDFGGEVSAATVLRRLAEGDFLRVKITIPEGTTVRDAAATIARGLELDSAKILALDKDTAFLREIDKPCLEGYLYPETYFLPWGLDEREAVRTVVGMFDRMTDGLWSEGMTLGLSKHGIVTLASIIESETSVPEERELVASVYVNRLREGWKLDADPTVIYGLGGLNRPLSRRDLRRDTPYNTYLHRGLPPTPINSPGLASIKAALDPASSEYYFFVATNNGGHYFSKTIAEHDRARVQARRNRLNP